MNEVDKIFKYKSNFLKYGIYTLIGGIILLPIGLLLSKHFSPGSLITGLGIGGVLMGVMLCFLYGIFYLMFKSRLKKYDKRYNIDTIKAELLAPDALKTGTIYFTKNYIISHNSGNIFIGRYDELMWIYINAVKQNGITIAKRIIGYTTTSKQWQCIIANVLDDNIMMQIFELIRSRNPNVLIGFTNENKEAYQMRLKNQL